MSAIKSLEHARHNLAQSTHSDNHISYWESKGTHSGNYLRREDLQIVRLLCHGLILVHMSLLRHWSGWQWWFCCRQWCNIAGQGCSFALVSPLWCSFSSGATRSHVSRVALILLGMKLSSGLCCGGPTRQKDTLMQGRCRDWNYESKGWCCSRWLHCCIYMRCILGLKLVLWDKTQKLSVFCLRLHLISHILLKGEFLKRALLARQQFCDDSQRTSLGGRYAIPDSFKKEKQPRPDVTQCTVTAVACSSLIQGALWASDEL